MGFSDVLKRRADELRQMGTGEEREERGERRGDPDEPEPGSAKYLERRDREGNQDLERTRRRER